MKIVTEASTAASKIRQIYTELLPKDWKLKGSHIIVSQISDGVDRRSKEMTVVIDKNKKIADVILPRRALKGGNVDILV